MNSLLKDTNSEGLEFYKIVGMHCLITPFPPGHPRKTILYRMGGQNIYSKQPGCVSSQWQIHRHRNFWVIFSHGHLIGPAHGVHWFLTDVIMDLGSQQLGFNPSCWVSLRFADFSESRMDESRPFMPSSGWFNKKRWLSFNCWSVCILHSCRYLHESLIFFRNCVWASFGILDTNDSAKFVSALAWRTVLPFIDKFRII